jgi:processive 1,2-diacylglycerol beta-glucosyltransferase
VNPNKPHLVVLSSGAGYGHHSAAAAILKVIRQGNDQPRVTLVDTSLFWRKTRGYEPPSPESFSLSALNNGKEFVKKMGLETGALKVFGSGLWHLRHKIAGPSLHRLQNLVLDLKPDLLVSTHPTPFYAAACLKQAGKLSALIHFIHTDYTYSRFALKLPFDRAYCANEQIRGQMIKDALPGEKIIASGIPIDLDFATPIDKAAFRASKRLDPLRLLIIVSMGGEGFESTRNALDQLLKIPFPVQIQVMCGRNEALSRELQARTAAENGPHLVRAEHNCTDVASWKQIATLFVGRAGGLNTTENLVTGLPSIIYRPNTEDHELFNQKHIVGNGAGLVCDRAVDIGATATALLDNPLELERMSRNAKQLGLPNAAADIARQIMESYRAIADDKSLQQPVNSVDNDLTFRREPGKHFVLKLNLNDPALMRPCAGPMVPLGKLARQQVAS